MAGVRCPDCGGFVIFREETIGWDFVPPVDFRFDIDKIRRKEIPKLDIDF
jgi:hypothetical protein